MMDVTEKQKITAQISRWAPNNLVAELCQMSLQTEYTIVIFLKTWFRTSLGHRGQEDMPSFFIISNGFNDGWWKSPASGEEICLQRLGREEDVLSTDLHCTWALLQHLEKDEQDFIIAAHILPPPAMSLSQYINSKHFHRPLGLTKYWTPFKIHLYGNSGT